MRSKADETLVIVETLICPLQISQPSAFVFISANQVFVTNNATVNASSAHFVNFFEKT